MRDHQKPESGPANTDHSEIRKKSKPLPRGLGDEHGGYIVDAEAEHSVAGAEEPKKTSVDGAADDPDKASLRRRRVP